MPAAFQRRIQIDLTQELIPQLRELLDDPDPEVARWAEENLRCELERTKFEAWLAERRVQTQRLPLEEPTLLEQFRAEQRPNLRLVGRK